MARFEGGWITCLATPARPNTGTDKDGELRTVRCTKEGERDMAQDILSLTKRLVRKAREALTLIRPASLQQRPQLDGRRGYGDGGIKSPNDG
jgi:hypothetical protein